MQPQISVSENFFSRVQLAAEKRRLSLAELAAQTGIALSTMYRWKESLPHGRTSRQLAETLSVSEEWLREGVGVMENEPAREEPTAYRFQRRAGAGSKTGVNPQPHGSAEMLSACQLMLAHFDHIDSTQALGYAMSGMLHALKQYEVIKLRELSSET